MFVKMIVSVLMSSFLTVSGLSTHAAQSKPLSLAELALYQGADREKILLDGAKREGQVTFYTSNTWVAGPMAQEFGKKYPFIKPNVWRSDSKELLKRLTEEVAAGRFLGGSVPKRVVFIGLVYVTGAIDNQLFGSVHD